MSIELSVKEQFSQRHIGPDEKEIKQMLETVGAQSLDEFVESVIPENLRTTTSLNLAPAVSETEALAELRVMASKNKVYRSLLGMGYSDTITPAVIQRNVLENPGWYTAYTPYQAEIAQGRMEALLNFQTMIIDLTGFPVANASLLDEATAAAEAMLMMFNIKGKKEKNIFFVSDDCHPQTIAVIHTRAKPLNIHVVVGKWNEFQCAEQTFGALLQYPASDGAVYDYRSFIEQAHQAGAMVAVATDLLALALLTPPGEFGADIALGNTQRFGVPLGYGGPHAAFFATKDEFKRNVPGRIIGVSIDALGNPALRMALQTREQHIRREKATSNICTSQVLLAIMASMYAVYHGPDGIEAIAERVHNLTKILSHGLKKLGYTIVYDDYFDTIRIQLNKETQARLKHAAESKHINLRYFEDGSISVSLDEVSTVEEVETVWSIFAEGSHQPFALNEIANAEEHGYAGKMKRTSGYLQHPVFNSHHSETEMLRYIRSLEAKDLSLTTSMIPLGSCTMKLNATTELMPVTWKEFGNVHPFVPIEQAQGCQELLTQLEGMLKQITGFAGVSLQPNSGAQGEYTGLLVIKAFHESRGESHRNVCLIPTSAHGTNPASAVMAGMNIVLVRCEENGNVDMNDLEAKAKQHSANLAAFMITYPSTHGVFEEGIKEMCEIIHRNGGEVYMDGANLNAQVGFCKPQELGADVCHINLHKTFSIPHGGGGPGMGPIAVAKHLAEFLPAHPVITCGGSKTLGSVSAAPWGSPSILPISWAYIRMMGAEGLKKATQVAMLNANYMAKRLERSFPILYTGMNERVAHEFILDTRVIKEQSGVEAEDISKRLMDYGFHAPTVSFPVPGTLMIEPTESESKEELDRYCDALISIRKEIEEIIQGNFDKTNNVLKNAPHTAAMVVNDEWNFPYTREKAAFPSQQTKARKFWVSVGRINNAYGDRNLVCSCPPIETYKE
ncbi:MAG: aminomethyl-transferring glycine dehydrogenase [Ignavibacteriales bacterium]|nr:aminomethyl-transferring glycine dehydrogenase [Ignavibacteriales bacterium]